MKMLTRWGLLVVLFLRAGVCLGFGAEPKAIVGRDLGLVEFSLFMVGSTGYRQLQLKVVSDGRLILNVGETTCTLGAGRVQAFVSSVTTAARWVERTEYADLAFERSVADFPGSGPRPGSVSVLVRRDLASGPTYLMVTLRGGDEKMPSIDMKFESGPLKTFAEVLAGAAAAIRLAREEATKADGWIDGTLAAPTPLTPNFVAPPGRWPSNAGGSPSAESAGDSLEGGWHTPKAGYPFQARKMRITGTGAIRVSTDASGRVVRAQMIRSIHALIDSTVESHARTAWKGPPNATKTVPVTYSLND